MVSSPGNLIVVPDTTEIHRGTLLWAGRSYPCALGRSGVTVDKREGDGATPVGIFPLGSTRKALSDMSGNAFEWTSSKYLDYPYRNDVDREDRQDGKTARVLRGGSWYYGKDYARISFRLRYHPGFRARTAGFRLVREK